MLGGGQGRTFSILTLYVLINILLLITILAINYCLFIFCIPRQIGQRSPITSAPERFCTIVGRSYRTLTTLPFRRISVASFSNLQLQKQCCPNIAPSTPLRVRFRNCHDPTVQSFYNNRGLTQRQNRTILLISRQKRNRDSNRDLAFNMGRQFSYHS